MCPDIDKSGSYSNSGAPEISIPDTNPVYEYLIDLQDKRLMIVEALAPGRHALWQITVCVSLIAMWLLDHVATLKGFPVALIILIGPLAIFGGMLLAGWRAQMLAVKALPSPFEYPKALELLLSTPLTAREIVSATLRAHIRYPFMGLTLKRVGLVVLNLILLTLILAETTRRGVLPPEVLDMSLKLYLPALCVFIYFPVLTGFDMLMVPSAWLRKGLKEAGMDREEVGRSGFMPAIAMTAALLPIINKINYMELQHVYNLRWVVMIACPTILLTIPLVLFFLALVLPGHLDKVRRGG